MLRCLKALYTCVRTRCSPDMTQNVRTNFLNWTPDAEDFGNGGLVKAENVIHESEGYKPVYLNTSGAFATTGAMGSVTAVQAKPIGSQGDYLAAWIQGNVLYVGVNGATALNVSTTPAFATVGSDRCIAFFDVTEYAGSWYVQAEAQQTEAGGTVTSVYAYGYSTITVA